MGGGCGCLAIVVEVAWLGRAVDSFDADLAEGGRRWHLVVGGLRIR